MKVDGRAGQLAIASDLVDDPKLLTARSFRGDIHAFKLQMKRDALEKIDRHANEVKGFDTVEVQ